MKPAFLLFFMSFSLFAKDPACTAYVDVARSGMTSMDDETMYRVDLKLRSILLEKGYTYAPKDKADAEVKYNYNLDVPCGTPEADGEVLFYGDYSLSFSSESKTVETSYTDSLDISQSSDLEIKKFEKDFTERFFRAVREFPTCSK